MANTCTIDKGMSYPGLHDYETLENGDIVAQSSLLSAAGFKPDFGRTLPLVYDVGGDAVARLLRCGGVDGEGGTEFPLSGGRSIGTR